MNAQMELSVYGDVKQELRKLPEATVALCSNKVEAYWMCMNQSIVRRSMRAWAELLEISPGYLSQILNSTSKKPKYMPPEVETRLMRLAGNLVPAQWSELAAQNKLACQKSKEARKQELLAELAELEAKTA